MTNYELLHRLGDTVSFFTENPKEAAFSHIELLDNQSYFTKGVLYLGTFRKYAVLSPAGTFEDAAVFLLAETTAAQLALLPHPNGVSILVSHRSQESLFNRISALMRSSPDAAETAWAQILSRKIVTAHEILAALFPDATAPGFYLQQLLFSPEDGKVDELLPALGRLFPDGTLIRQKRTAVVLRRHQSQLFRFPLPPGIDTWLGEHRCLLCVGNATRDLSMIRTNAVLLAQTCRLGSRLRKPEQRILYLEEYQMMITIDNSVKEFIRKNGHADICYLAHPALIHIARYDFVHRTNLREVLYQYLAFGGNIQRTAETLYMHRNTVLNKLKKIHELIDFDFSDGLLCQRLLLSCQLMEYQEKILRRPIDWEKRYEER